MTNQKQWLYEHICAMNIEGEEIYEIQNRKI